MRPLVSSATVHALGSPVTALGLVVALAPSGALADPPLDSPWALPPPLPPTAASPVTQPPVAPQAIVLVPATPPTSRPPRKAWLTLGVMGAIAIPTGGAMSEALSLGGAGLIFGSEEFARRLSARFEAGLRSHGAASDRGGQPSLLSFNTGLRIYLLYEGPIHPYLGAHFGTVIALGGATASSPGIGLALGGSGGANFPINESLEVGAELRYETVFPFGGSMGYGSSIEGGLLSVMGSFAFIFY